MFFGDSMPYVPHSATHLWLFTFLLNLGLFVLFASAVFSIADEFKALIRPRKIIPYSLITVSLGIIIDLIFIWISNAALQADAPYDDFYRILAIGGFQLNGFRFIVLPALFCFALLMLVQYFLIRGLFGNLIQTRRSLWMSGLIAFLTHPVWVAIFMAMRTHA